MQRFMMESADENSSHLGIRVRRQPAIRFPNILQHNHPSHALLTALYAPVQQEVQMSTELSNCELAFDAPPPSHPSFTATLLTIHA